MWLLWTHALLCSEQAALEAWPKLKEKLENLQLKSCPHTAGDRSSPHAAGGKASPQSTTGGEDYEAGGQAGGWV